jgi:hypothetical protein
MLMFMEPCVMQVMYGFLLEHLGRFKHMIG